METYCEMYRFCLCLFLGIFPCSEASECTGLSEDVGCNECDEFGHCVRGTVPVDPWLDFALKTQRELQISKPFDKIQMMDAHNAYNSKEAGFHENDTCIWPPPYNPTECVGMANQVFSFTDLLQMGIRGLELDNWFCFDEMRVSYLVDPIEFPSQCYPDDRLFSDALKKIADWLDEPEDNDEIIRIYINEKYDQGNDDKVNDPLEEYFGSRILTPKEFNDTYNRQWPTMEQMREDGKNVVIFTGSTAGSGDFYTHGDVFIHKIFWADLPVKDSTDYPDCGGKTRNNARRFWSDSTHYYGTGYDGPSAYGVILNLTEYVKCDVQYPGADHVNPEFLKTGVFTWAEGQPSPDGILEEDSCIILSGLDSRWHVADSCSYNQYYFACQSIEDPDQWTVSLLPGPYDRDNTYCPDGYQFGTPEDG